MRIKKIIFFLLLLFPFCIVAQQSNIKFDHLTIKDGLSQSDVRSITQDTKGLMWFGTQDGLNVYNGFDFQHFSHDLLDSTSISNSYIHEVYEDSNGLLWIGTENGLNIFDRGTYRFRSVLNNKENAKNNVWTLVEDGDNIWVGTENNLLKINKLTFEIVKVNLMLSTYIKKLRIRKLIFLKGEKELLIATEGNGLIRFNTKDNKSEQFYQDNSLLKSNIIWGLYQDSEELVWLSTNNGICFFDVKQNKIYSKVKIDKTVGTSVIKLVYEDKSGIFWIGTESKGVFRLKSTSNIEHYQYSPNVTTSLSNNKVNSIYEDNSGIVWVGTQSGVDKFDKQKQYFKHYQHWSNMPNTISSNMIWSIYHDQDNLWIGTDKGVDVINELTEEIQTLIPEFPKNGNQKNKSVYSIFKDHKNIMYIGTDGGLFTVDKTFAHVNADGANNSRVYTILEDRKNRLWLGTRNGLLIVSENRKEFRTIEPDTLKGGLLGEVVRTLIEDSKGNIWVGTDGGGLCRVIEQGDDIKFKNYVKSENDINSLSNNTVLSLFEDKKGLIWIGTFGGGINIFNPVKEKFYRYTEKEGLSNNVVYGIEDDKDGNLWMSTNKGISQFIKATQKFKIFEESDGLQSNEFNNGAYYKSKSGQLYFGGINGFNSFYPEDVRYNKSKPKAIITNFFLFNKPVKIGKEEILKKHISELDEIVLKYKENVISFEFASLHYSYPLKNQHKYKLENFNEEWVDIGNNRRANYTNLNPGEYIFKVKVSNSDGVWSDDVASIKIIVEPPFYLTWWFVLIIILLLISATYGFFVARVNRVKAQKQLLELQVQERTYEVIKQKEKIEEQKRLLEKEKEKAEKLLLNVLPEQTAAELISKGKATARSYRLSSIMFTDFKGFTKIAEKIPAIDLVTELDFYFKKFDEIIEKYDIEKIKTIGDAYMCAGGIPIRNKSNPIDIVLAGLDVQRFMKKHSKEKEAKGEKGWGLRVGIHTGEIIAGVVGIKRFAYDIWGDSVNVASRIEAASGIGKVNISGTTYNLVKEFFDCEYRGKIKAKNKGHIDMYFVKSIKSELSVNGEGVIPNELFKKYVDLHIYSTIHYRKAEKYILKRLREELPDNLHYHDINHTIDVCAAVERLALMEGVEGDDIFLLKTAALYHDGGFVEEYAKNEPIGARMAREVLPQFGYDEAQIQKIEELILATRVPQQPKNKLEEIICDADLDYLGRDEFHFIADKLKRELMERNIIQNDIEWDTLQVKFLEAHHYFTGTAIKLRQKMKEKRIIEIKERLGLSRQKR